MHLVKTDVPKTPRHTSGEVIKICGLHGIYLDPQDANDLHITGYMKVHVVLEPKLYIEVEAISAEEFEILPDQKDLGGFSALRNLPEFTYRYGTSIDGPGKTACPFHLHLWSEQKESWIPGGKVINSSYQEPIPYVRPVEDQYMSGMRDSIRRMCAVNVQRKSRENEKD